MSFRRVLPGLGLIIVVALITPATALAAPARRTVPTPVADYQFQNTLASADGGVPALTNIGTGNAFATDTVSGVSHTVLTFTKNRGVELTPTTGVVASNEYSIVVLARLKAIHGFLRLVDFKHGTVDTGLYSDSGSLNFYSDASGTQSPIKRFDYFQVVLTRDAATKTVVGYVNGAQQFSFKDTAKDAVIDRKSELRFFADDKAVPGEDSAGWVARIRLYNTVLSASDVENLGTEPTG
jgi:hypothetical protein